MKNLFRLLLPVAVVALLAATPALGSRHTCKPILAPTGDTSPIAAYNTGCKTARRVAKTLSTKGKIKHWTCSSKPYQGGAKVTCRKHKAKVVWSISD